jgi:2-desacetyl-2-hydroxyethyl bacteriochlorophyllide A dehydrogenase
MPTMRAAVVAGPGSFSIREFDLPAPGPGEALVRVRNCGICGSDLHFYRGDFPAMPNLVMGHEIAGEVAAVGEGVSNVREGDRVAVEPLIVCGRCAYCRSGSYQLCPERKLLGTFAPGGFAEYVRIPAAMLYPLPDEVPFELGALVEPVAVAVHGLRLVRFEGGERVLVLGGGTIGLVSAAAALALGAAEVAVTARYAHQRAVAETLGARALDANDPAAVSAFADAAPPDVVVETVGGKADTLNQAAQLVRAGGRISLLGLFTGAVSLNATLFLLKEALMAGSITYGRPSLRSDFEVAVEVVRRMRDSLAQLITHRVPLESIAQGFATAADKTTGSIKVTVQG